LAALFGVGGPGRDHADALVAARAAVRVHHRNQATAPGASRDGVSTLATPIIGVGAYTPRIAHRLLGLGGCDVVFGDVLGVVRVSFEHERRPSQRQ
jgi:hypothetical protein